MGVFDYVTCDYVLPWGNDSEREWQSKTTPAQWMDRYVIRVDGSLWHEACEIEDHSDPNATGLLAIQGCMTRVNTRWELEPVTGEIDFHSWDGPSRLSYIATFDAGQLTHLREGQL